MTGNPSTTCERCSGMGFLLVSASDVPNERKYAKCEPCAGAGRVYLDIKDAGRVALGGYAPTLPRMDPSKLRPWVG